MLEAEVDDFLGRRRYQRAGEYRGYRSGHLPQRTIGEAQLANDGVMPRFPVSCTPGYFALGGVNLNTTPGRAGTFHRRNGARTLLERLTSVAEEA